MSLKWQRSRAWDEEHIPSVLWPIKALLRLFSSVKFGVGLLVFVVLFAIVASVPIGLLARIPTLLLYAASVVIPVTLLAGGTTIVTARFLAKRHVPRAARFLLAVVLGFGVKSVCTWAWYKYAWPHLHYDAGTRHGVLLFADFVNQYNATTLRRLPGLEMSELEFYAWWPLRTVLLLFVVNMIVATLRRIEFNIRNIGVLTVHTGIVVIALGSIYYSGLKLEGDTVLFAGRPGTDGVVKTAGPAQDRFFDNIRVALYVNSGMGWEQRPLRGVPRYNDYGLSLAGGSDVTTAWEASLREPVTANEPDRSLNVAVMDSPQKLIDPAVKFRVVGYASYATSVDDWVEDDPAKRGGNVSVRPGERLNPLRIAFLHSEIPDQNGKTSDKPVLSFTLLPMSPAGRVAANSELGVEYTMGSKAGMTPERWRDLSEPLPAGTEHALVVEVPGAVGGSFRAVIPAVVGSEVAVGTTGYRLTVKELDAQPPFPIITEGYRNATSSVAIVRVTTPSGTSFDRWVYHRFNEINQDMLDEMNDRGMPKRRDADPAIRVSYIDASPLMQVYFDEAPDGTTRAIVRSRGGEVRVVERVSADMLPLVPKLSLKIGTRWVNARAIQRPMPVAADRRDKSMVGTHDQAMLGVRVSMAPSSGASTAGSEPWGSIVWLPFTKYMGVGQDNDRRVTLPNGREISLAFGRQQHRLPGFAVQLVDFKMIAYDHRGAPRDYQSTLRVTPMADPFLKSIGRTVDFAAFDHVAKLNEPLMAPFHWDDSRAWAANFFGRLRSGLSPYQFKFSQAGWDQQGWAQSQAMVDRGLAKQPSVGFTILGVGNNPGIHLIALGGGLMAVGVPWAFYFKPYLVRREKRKLQAQIAAGTYKKPARSVKAGQPESKTQPELESVGAAMTGAKP